MRLFRRRQQQVEPEAAPSEPAAEPEPEARTASEPEPEEEPEPPAAVDDALERGRVTGRKAPRRGATETHGVGPGES